LTENGASNAPETARNEAQNRRFASPPDDLDAESRRFWNRTRRALEAQGTWDDLYVPLLERYVRACEAARRVRAEIPDHGTARGSQGQLVEHPLTRTVRQAERDAHCYAQALLLLPADRLRRGPAEDPPSRPSWLQP
jgi:P27 family predicted phage terminase small subunit